MKRFLSSLLAAALLLTSTSGYGMGMERFGPSKDVGHPSVVQSDWPAGMVHLVDHDSRIYSSWVNGGENFYFKATSTEVLELVRLFSEMRLRDHVVSIKAGPLHTKSFDGERIVCNVSFEHLGGIVGAMRRRSDAAETFEPTLVIYVDSKADSNWWKTASIPENVKLLSEVDGWPAHETESVPKRRLRYARVVFEDDQPASDYKHDLNSQITLWDDAEQPGFDLGRVDHEGNYHAAFSEEEWQKLQSGEMWLTLTVGGHSLEPRHDDSKLDASNLELDPAAVKAFRISRPK